MPKGFSLIELMVVLTLFGLATTLVTASYLRFEKAQRLKNAALQMVSDLRYVQNKATEQDKGLGGICPSVSTLGGWYLFANYTTGSNTSYKIGGVCINGAIEPNETYFYDSPSISQKEIKLPRDIRVNRISTAGFGDFTLPVAFLFRPQKIGVSYHNGVAAVPGGTNPGFLQTDLTLDNLMPGAPQNTPVSIELANSSGDTYKVVIQPSGEVNEGKP